MFQYKIQSQINEEFAHLVSKISYSEISVDVLAHRDTRITVRTASSEGAVVIKLWKLSDYSSRLRKIANWTKGQQEWRALTSLHRSGLPVPKPLYFFRLPTGAPHSEALIISDLGKTENIGSKIHEYIKYNRYNKVENIDDRLISITKKMLDLNITDNDHRVYNFVDDINEKMWRIDFENTASFNNNIVKNRAISSMLGALISSHAWACRFYPSATRRFSNELYKTLKPPLGICKLARKKALYDLYRLKKSTGFDLDMAIGW